MKRSLPLVFLSAVLVWSAVMLAYWLSAFFEDRTPALVTVAASVLGAHASLELGIAVSAAITLLLLTVVVHTRRR